MILRSFSMRKKRFRRPDVKAIEKFESAARDVGFNVEIIGKEDYDRIPRIRCAVHTRNGRM